MKKIFFLFLCFCPLGAWAQTNLYVSPKGNDNNKGTMTNPFASIKKAVLEANKKGGKVVINLLEGTFYLKEPLIFTSKDARKASESLTIKKSKNQKVTISGSVVLNLQWIPFKNGIWQAKIARDYIFDELFVNGQLQRMARYPNYDSTAQYFGGTAADAISKEKAVGWKAPQGGYVHALHGSQWGDFHYMITGKNEKGEPALEGGWQNNRRMGMHDKYRFVENIFEELDTVNEWFYDKNTKILYYLPPKGLNIQKATFEVPQIAHLIEFRGTKDSPIRNINIEGVKFTQTLRTFMQNKEPLLRSDWTIYRGGAIVFNGTENCTLKNCELNNLGGNAIFFNNYNKGCEVSGCIISEIGASACCFVGDINAVRSPSFEYYQFVPLSQIDRTPGPKTNNYPQQCRIYNNLMFNLGLIEKQSAGVEISMSEGIIISHNTIYDVPRAGINVSEGTWGGHIIEYNDVFNTVKESGDHGSFNSWGRDRYWHPDKIVMDSIVEKNFELALLDVVKPIILRNNRMRCDHGWDIDLDDGASNYQIYNNLCLNGGLKLREGVNRIVENNIFINNTFHPHVWFSNSNDVFRHNIVLKDYAPINIKVWGKEVDYNMFSDDVSLKEAQNRGTDMHSVSGSINFMNPTIGDFRLKKESKAFSIGFKNFTMDNFGVISLGLKRLSKKVPLPEVLVSSQEAKEEVIDFLGAKVKNLTTLGERSATGMNSTSGVLVINVPVGSVASKFLQINDVILEYHHQNTVNIQDLLHAYQSSRGANTTITFFRNQKAIKTNVSFQSK